MSLFSRKKSILGIDIGTANIKIAQVSQDQSRLLETYGMVNTPYQLTGKNDARAVSGTADLLKGLMEKAGVSSDRCVISFPNSSVFTSVIEMPQMKESELGSAVEFEAKKYVPLSLAEVDLAWSIISDQKTSGHGLKILLTAVPKQITENYMRVFELARLTPEVGEIEALALIRSLIGNSLINCVIMDIGAKGTSLNMIESGLLRLSRNLNIGGDTITARIAEALRITETRAEQFKKDFGISNASFIPETIKPVLDIIKTEVKQLLTIYQSHSEKVEKIILVGGGASLPGLSAYFSDLGAEVQLGNPLQAVSYSENVAQVVERYSLSLPVAIGLALRNE